MKTRKVKSTKKVISGKKLETIASGNIVNFKVGSDLSGQIQ